MVKSTHDSQSKQQFWINTISCDHVMRGIEGGFTQAGHGKNNLLKQLNTDDWIAFYSPKTAFRNGHPLQAFTAIGQIADEKRYQVEMAPDFHPWRRNVTFYDCNTTPIKPLIYDLSFIKNKTHWGFPFRFGLFQIPERDFKVIRNAMIEEE